MDRMRASVSDPIIRPCEVFDLIVGTAAGGLIAILLGRLGMTCDEAINAYTELESELFPSQAITDILTNPNPFNTKLKTIITSAFGQHGKPLTITDILTNPNPFNTVRFENKLKTIITGALGQHASPFMFDTANKTGCMVSTVVLSGPLHC